MERHVRSMWSLQFRAPTSRATTQAEVEMLEKRLGSVQAVLDCVEEIVGDEE